MADRKIYKGTELKYMLNIEAQGFSMDDDDFEVTLISNRKRVTIKKDEMVIDEQGHFLFCFDTELLGTGDIILEITAYVPDDDFPDGLRTEKNKMMLCRVLA